MAVDLVEPRRDDGQMLQRLANGVVDALEAQVRASERQRELLLEQCVNVVGLGIQLGARVRRQWRTCCDEVGAGRTEAAHASRSALARDAAETLRLLERFWALVTRTAALSGQEVRGTKELSSIVAWLERFRDVVLAAWTGPETVEELAGEHYPLSSEELDAIGAQRPVPLAWYEQEGKPF